MFRGKESSNRFELSQLVQDIDFWCFGLPVALGGGWWVDGGWGGWGVPPTHLHMHAHACMHTHTHACVVNMVISCKWLPPLGKSLGIPYDVICTCMHVHKHVCACVCTWVRCTPSPPLTPSTHPQGGTSRIIQNSIALELIKISQFCLKI